MVGTFLQPKFSAFLVYNLLNMKDTILDETKSLTLPRFCTLQCKLDLALRDTLNNGNHKSLIIPRGNCKTGFIA